MVNQQISIITPSYNQGEFIEQTIQSVLNQTYKHIEYIIVDGGSTDNTMEIIAKYRDRISVVISEKDKGQSDAINKGFKLATGTLAGWINSDDILYPDCVEQIVKLYNEHPDGSIYYPAVLDVLDAKGNRLNEIVQKIPDRYYLLNVRYDVIQPGSFYATKHLKAIGYLDETIYYAMDLDLWLRLMERGKIHYYADHALSGFRIWDNSKTNLGGKHFLNNTKQILDRHGARKISRARLNLLYIRCRIVLGQIKRFIFQSHIKKHD